MGKTEASTAVCHIPIEYIIVVAPMDKITVQGQEGLYLVTIVKPSGERQEIHCFSIPKVVVQNLKVGDVQECSHDSAIITSTCCGADVFYGVCGMCHNHTGWELFCRDCGEIIDPNVEPPQP